MEKQDNASKENDNVSPPKLVKTDPSLQAAFTNSKKLDKSKIASGSKYTHLLVSPKQKGNPLLKFITGHWEYSDIVPDYIMGKTMCALFLSVRYHQLNPDYIHDRLKLLGNAFNLRVLLVQM